MTTQQHRLRGRGRLTTIGLVLAVLALAASPGVAKAEPSFTDGLGDGRGAPDIMSAAVSNDAKGEFTIMVLAFVVAPPDDVRVTVILDTDRNTATGSDGFDYAFQYDASNNTHAVGRWDGTTFAFVDAPTAAVNWTALSVMFTINRSDLGGTNGFDFWIRSHRGASDSGQFDDAPNDGTWGYTYAAPPEIAKLTYPSTLTPRAGKLFDARQVQLQLSDGTSVAPQRLTCRLTAGGVVVKQLRGGCRWQIPKRLKGKTVVMTLVAGYGEAELRVTKRLVVR